MSQKDFNFKNRPNWKKIAIVGKKPIDLMKAYEEYLEGFEKQEQEKQNMTLETARGFLRTIKIDWDQAKQRNHNFCEGYLEGFLFAYLQRGKEILVGENQK